MMNVKQIPAKDLEYLNRLVALDQGRIFSYDYRCRIRRGERWPSDEAIRRLAEANGSTFEDVLGQALGIEPALLKGLNIPSAIARWIGFEGWQKAGLARPTYWTWMRGERWPRHETLMMLARYCHLDSATDVMRAAVRAVAGGSQEAA